jgi:predicted kinase
MRKWMRDRLKRRTKEPEKALKDAAQAPLQPSFYDVSPVNAVTAAEGKQSEPSAVQLDPAPAPPDARLDKQDVQPRASGRQTVEQSSPGGQDAGRGRRRRRGRGGRGRTRKATSSSVADSTGLPALSSATPDAQPGETPASTASSAAAMAPRPSKGVVVLAIGLPGSGKSSWFKRHEITPLSADLLRVLLFDDATEQRFQDLIFSNLRSMLKARLIARRPTNYVDATNLTPHERQGWIKLAKDYGYEVQAVFFDVPAEVCLERNQRRQRVVPDDAMRRMAAKLRAPTFQEGFAKITVVKVKKKEGEPAAD